MRLYVEMQSWHQQEADLSAHERHLLLSLVSDALS